MIKKNNDNASIQDFTKLNIVLGTILEAFQNEKAKKPAYILKIDFGKKLELNLKYYQIQISKMFYQFQKKD